MKIPKNIAISEDGFLFNPATGDSFSTNLTGADIINLLKTEISSDEIVKFICQKYEIDNAVFERDLEDFLLQLKEFRMLE